MAGGCWSGQMPARRRVGAGRLLVPVALDGGQAHGQLGGGLALGQALGLAGLHRLGGFQRLGASAFLRGAGQAFLGAFPDPVTLEGGHGSQHCELQLAGGAGQVHAVEVEVAELA